MNTTNPLISAIIPTYNRGLLIEKAIESVLAQTYKKVEIIVVDDGSTDETQDVLKKYEGKIISIYQNNKGVSSARNHGISAAKGEFIAFLDSDDIWMPDKLDQQLNIIREDNSVGLVGCSWYDIDYSGKNEHERILNNYSNHSVFFNELSIRNIFGGGSCPLVNKELFNRAGLFDESLKFGEDWDMWLRLAKYCNVRFVETPLFKYRLHDIDKGYKKENIIKSNITAIIEKNASGKKMIKRKAYSYMYNDLAGMSLNKKKKFKTLIYILKSFYFYPFKLLPTDNKVKILIRSILPEIIYAKIKDKGILK